MNQKIFKELCALCGTSGREHEIRAYILDALKAMNLPEDAVTVDRLGNILVQKKGAATAKRKVMLSAHMDEVALMITDIHADGTLAFDAVGGVSASAVIGRQVQVGDKRIAGVIGCKPVHLLSKDEKNKPASLHSLCCDIGAGSKDAAEAQVRRGDIIYFCGEPMELGDGSLMSKAIDDRFGCALLLELLQSDLPYDTDFAFVVQEEVGLRGAGVAAAQLDPDIAIVFEATTAEFNGTDAADRCCDLGKGAVISFMDGRTIYDKALYDLAVSLCEARDIPWQTKTKIAGGNDAGAIQSAGRGARVLAVSVPCRYLHSPLSVIWESDAEACETLAFALVSALQEESL